MAPVSSLPRRKRSGRSAAVAISGSMRSRIGPAGTRISPLRSPPAPPKHPGAPARCSGISFECERLARDLSRQAAEQHPAIVQHLDRALRLVLEDPGVSPSGFFEALWMTPE